jgi:hypothetical protein
MRISARQAVGLAVMSVMTAGTGWGQVKPACDSKGMVKSPEMVEGQVSKVDLSQGRLTVRSSGGEEYEFLASSETLQDYKVGDPIKAKLRQAPKCQEK